MTLIPKELEAGESSGDGLYTQIKAVNADAVFSATPADNVGGAFTNRTLICGDHTEPNVWYKSISCVSGKIDIHASSERTPKSY